MASPKDQSKGILTSVYTRDHANQALLKLMHAQQAALNNKPTPARVSNSGASTTPAKKGG